ncbi:hypothetical protein RB595_003507 [Gaeumannomyces hyphopodioides]
MSDPFSIVAGVCGLAVQIVDTGIKIKTLYEQFDGAPSSLRDTIDLIQLHAADLSPAIPIGDQAEIPLQTAAVLAVSKAHCQKVLEELQGVAGELHAQLEKAQGRGSARRRLATLKIVLKKDFLAQHEARLAQASGLLMQAKLSYIITLVQQLRVEIRVPDTRAPLHMPDTGRGRILEAPNPGNMQEVAVYTTVKETRSSDQSSSSTGGMRPPRLSGPFRRIGLAQLTGCVEIHLPARHYRCHRCLGAVKDGYNSHNDPFWLRLRLPRWICNLVIESSIIHSTTGWLNHITTYRLHNSTASKTVMDAIAAGDISKLRRLFQTRELGPRDIVTRYGEELTLVEVAISERQWDVGTFLLNHGADTGRLIILRDPPGPSPHPPLKINGHKKSRRYSGIRGFISANIKVYLESGIGPQQDRTLQARKAVLESTLDENDFSSSFPLWVEGLLEFQSSLWLVDQARRLLGGVMDTSKPLRPKSYDVYLDAIDQMNYKFGHMWWQPADVFAAYCALFRDLICKELREHYGDTSREILLDCMTMLRGFWLCYRVSPQMSADYVDQLAHAWFEMILSTSGISGQGWENVVQELMDGDWDREYSLAHGFGRKMPRPYVRLISVKGGPRPEDWKFWWSQHNDDLVGEFWSLVEQEEEERGYVEEQPLCAIPGAWVE